MSRLRAVVVKELRQVRRDPFSLAMLVGLPAFMLVLYGFALNFDVRHVRLALQDLDRSAASRELVASFTYSTYFDLAATPGAGTDLESLLERRAARAVLVIPAGYGHDLAAGRSAPVQLLLDGADSTTATTVLGYARALVAEQNLRIQAGTLRRAGVRAPPALDLEPRVLFNPQLESTQFLVPGLIGFLLMLTAVLSTALSVVREKERGTMEQLRVAPLRTWELIVGKTVPYLGISLVATFVILLAARILFGVVIRGPYLDLLGAVLLYLFSALALRPVHLDRGQHAAAGVPGRADRVSAARDPALRLHLPDPHHAGLAAARHLPGAGALLPRDPARHHPEGRGPRDLLAAGRSARSLLARGGRPRLGAALAPGGLSRCTSCGA